jgi:hypothetical protein
MGLGMDLSFKVEAPKVDLGAAATNMVETAASALAQVQANSAKVLGGAVSLASAKGTELAAVPGAVLDVDVSYAGATEDMVMEPHLVIGADAGTRTLRLRLTDYEFEPYAGRPYCVSSADGTTVYSKEGAETDDQGVIEVDLPDSVSLLKIVLAPEDESDRAEEWTVDAVDELPEMSREKAVLTRLFSLGYYLGEPVDVWGEDEMAALRWFQAENGLPATGEIDDESMAQLIAQHGN